MVSGKVSYIFSTYFIINVLLVFAYPSSGAPPPQDKDPQTIACIWLRLRKLHHLHCAGTHHDCLYSFHIHVQIFCRFGALHLM